MGWDERMRFNAAAPATGGLAAMARAVVGSGAVVVEVRRLTGGVDAATHAVRVDPGGWLVVKRVRGGGRGAASLAAEHDRLTFARRAPVATPEPLALDMDGVWFGHPALVMRRLDGNGVFHERTGAWIDDLAAALGAVHGTPLDGAIPAALRSPHAGVAWQPGPPSELPRTARVEALIDVGLTLREDPAAGETDVLLHHDYHHGNVLWQDQRISGVVDWNEACIGPALCDVGYCSVDLAMSHGLAASDRFTVAYGAAATGTPLADLDRWHCLWTANAMRWIGHWIVGFHQAGIDLSLDLARERLDALADQTLTRIGRRR